MKIVPKLFITFLFAFLVLSSVAYAEQKVVTSEGKYMLGLLDSKKDAKALALMDAKRKAIEQAIKYLEGLPEVQNFQLTEDQINTLATNITSVDIQSEDWRTSGETNISVVIPIRAIVDTSNLKDKVAKIRENDLTESIKETQSMLVSLYKELDLLKASQQKQDIIEKTAPPVSEKKAAEEIKPALLPQTTLEKKDQSAKDQKAIAEIPSPAQPQAAPDKKEQPEKEQKPVVETEIPIQKQELPEDKNVITNEEKQKYESVLKNVFALDSLEKGNIALADQRWNDAQYAFSKAIELNPALAHAYTGKSSALQNSNQQQEALKHVDIALKLNPQSAGALGIKALLLKDLPGKINQALKTATDAIKLKPDNPRFYKIRGEVYKKMGKILLAKKDFWSACKLGSKESCGKARSLK